MRYEILDSIGESTHVVRARRTLADGVSQDVVIKRAVANVPRETFVAEARLAAQLDHPNLVRTLDLRLDGEPPFFVMEMVRGLSLEELRAHLGPSGTCPPWVAVDIALQIASALSYLHALRDAQGRHLALVHRDLSPTNVMLSIQGIVKLIDFGLASGTHRTTTTAVGVARGTPGFTAPEVFRGEVATPRSDLFSLGCLLHYLLAGSSPMATPATRNEVVAGGPVPLAALADSRLSRTLRTLLQSMPNARPDHAREAEEALEGLAWELKREERTTSLARWMASLEPAADAGPTDSNPYGVLFLPHGVRVRKPTERMPLADELEEAPTAERISLDGERDAQTQIEPTLHTDAQSSTTTDTTNRTEQLVLEEIDRQEALRQRGKAPTLESLPIPVRRGPSPSVLLLLAATAILVTAASLLVFRLG